MYDYRGFMIDSARHYQPIEDIKEIIRAMAKLKFNKFHWHLTEDQGWRIEIEKYPLLNTKAAIRPYSDFGKTHRDEPYGIIYTKDEMRDIVKFCGELGIDVIPEFDMPGHTSALLSAYPEYSCGKKDIKIKTHQGIYKDILCIAKDETVEFVKDILDEIMEIFPYEYIHIGGDEVPSAQWENCVLCQSVMNTLGITDYTEYQNTFINKIIDYLESKGRHGIVWNDIAKGKNLDKRAVIQYWKENDKATIEFINSGGKAILSPFSYYYTDYYYEITPLNRVYSFNPDLKGLTEEGKKNIIGLETPMWTEYVETKEYMQKLMFPRVIATAYTALGKNDMPYSRFLCDVRAIRAELEKDGIVFEDEKEWTYSRAHNPIGWKKFANDHYTKDFFKALKDNE
ncbi:MAG: family 20 glycosylhydrolase [Eubacterium sp.]|nr:family 20 glycosylhydrolase [Eubacterium sp.]